MADNKDDYSNMFEPGWQKNVGVIFSCVCLLVAAALVYGVIWFERIKSDNLRAVQVIVLNLGI